MTSHNIPHPNEAMTRYLRSDVKLYKTIGNVTHDYIKAKWA